MQKRSATSVSLLLILVGASFMVASPAGAHSSEAVFVTSFDGTQIDINVCKPDGASAADPVPLIFWGPGWAGTKAGCDSLAGWNDDGYGVISITPRGFGSSGGQANVHDPDLEGKDYRAVIDYAASLDWIQKETGPDACGPDDVVLGAIGGSYGGAYQLITALDETASWGCTRFDAIAPEIAWFSLPQSLAPYGVVRSVWVDALYAVGAPSLPDYIHQSYAHVQATGRVPTGPEPFIPDLVAEFEQHGPSGFVAGGVQLGIPALIRQGVSDNLFNLNEGIHNFQRTLTDDARAESLFVGFNGGHALPTVLPLGTAGGNTCEADLMGGTGGWSELQRAWYDHHLKGEAKAYDDSFAYNIMDEGSTCVRTNSVDTTATFPVDGLAGAIATTTMIGAPQHHKIADGPLTVSGIPTLSATLTTAGIDARAFLAVSIGSTPLDAQVIGHNVMPINKELPVVLESLEMELQGMAATVEEGQSLFLTVSPASDMFVTHGSRTPGAIVLTDVTVDLPVV
ncbi:MAG: CocE/NonD family hydrolase [Thermoplasmatota archaeon]